MFAGKFCMLHGCFTVCCCELRWILSTEWLTDWARLATVGLVFCGLWEWFLTRTWQPFLQCSRWMAMIGCCCVCVVLSFFWSFSAIWDFKNHIHFHTFSIFVCVCVEYSDCGCVWFGLVQDVNHRLPFESWAYGIAQRNTWLQYNTWHNRHCDRTLLTVRNIFE